MHKLNTVHFFGEMDLNLNSTVKAIYKKAFKISECCGYMVECEQRQAPDNKKTYTLSLLGEDCPDSLQVENLIHFDGNTDKARPRKVQKVVYRITYDGLGRDQKQIKKMIQVFDYIPETEQFKEIWNIKAHLEKLQNCLIVSEK